MSYRMEGLKAKVPSPGELLYVSAYPNNVIEQDHRTVKKRVWLAKGDTVGQVLFIAWLFGLAA
jgi:hypothetical protein